MPFRMAGRYIWLPHDSGMRWQVGGRGRRVAGRVLRRQPGGDGMDVRFRQAVGDALHAIGLGGLPVAGAPARELRDDVRRAQAREARDARLHAGEAGAVAT